MTSVTEPPETQAEHKVDIHTTAGKLADLRNKMAGNDKLEDLLSEVLKNTENAKKLGAKQNGGEDA